MKFVAILILAFLTNAVAKACPNLSGDYVYVNETWNGNVKVEQADCNSIKLIRERGTGLKVARETLTLRTDGRPYVGYNEATKVATAHSKAFHISTWVKDALVIRQYLGSLHECDGDYAPNRSVCHVTEYVLKPSADRLQVTWTQTGVWWNEAGDAVKQYYVLSRQGLSCEPVAMR